jgi:hypothetical protein
LGSLHCQPLYLGLLEQITFNTPDIDHGCRTNHHDTHPEIATHWSFVVVERAFDSTDSCFDGCPQAWF